MIESYKEYLERTSSQDERRSWIAWKMECYGMSEEEAIKAAYDPEWGYEAIK